MDIIGYRLTYSDVTDKKYIGLKVTVFIDDFGKVSFFGKKVHGVISDIIYGRSKVVSVYIKITDKELLKNRVSDMRCVLFFDHISSDPVFVEPEQLMIWDSKHV